MTITSRFFQEEDLFVSSTARRLGIDNTATDGAIRDNLQRLVRQAIDPVCGILGTKIHLNSVYRCKKLNTAVGGAGSKPGQKPSAHMDGRALDFCVSGYTKEQLREVFNTIRRSKIPYDQLIFECDAWIHLGIAPENVEPRRQDLLASGTPGNWVYKPAPKLPA